MTKHNPPSHEIITELTDTGFTCTTCAACCTGPDALVIVSPSEIRELIQATNLLWDEIVIPYPEYIIERKIRLTFGWALRHKKDQCIFLEQNRCTVYHARPWICKTYPFMLNQEHITPSTCPGLGRKPDSYLINQLARDLISRQYAEEQEEAEIAHWYQIFCSTPPDTKASLIVIDSEGIKPQP